MNEISARVGDNLLTINGGVNGVTVLGPGLAVAGTMRATTQVTTPSVVESDETQCLSRVLVSHSAAGGVVGVVLKNTASTGVARCSWTPTPPPASRSWRWWRLATAPSTRRDRRSGCRTASRVIIETDGVVTTAYGQNDLSDEKVKQNVRDADLDELQVIVDRAVPKRYDRADVCQTRLLGPGLAGRRRHREDEVGRGGVADA